MPPAGLRERIVPPAAERGVALVLVLWIAVALTLIGTVMATSLQRELRATHDILQAAKTRQAARAGISRGLVHLRSLPAEEMRLLALAGVAGEWHHFDLDGVSVRYRIFSELGRVDLNRADRELIRGLLLAAGADPAQLDMLTDNILDWRDPSAATRLHGTSPDAYRESGWPDGRRDGDFESVEELQQVAGFTPELYRQLAPYLTVHTRARQPAPEYAAIAVLAAHPGVDPGTASGWARERDQIIRAGTRVLPPFPGGGARGGETGIFGIESVASSGAGSAAHIEVIVDARPGQRLPVTVLEWREPPLWRPGAGTS